MLFEFNFNFLHKLLCREQQMDWNGAARVGGRAGVGEEKHLAEEVFKNSTHTPEKQCLENELHLNGCIITEWQVERIQ